MNEKLLTHDEVLALARIILQKFDNVHALPTRIDIEDKVLQYQEISMKEPEYTKSLRITLYGSPLELERDRAIHTALRTHLKLTSDISVGSISYRGSQDERNGSVIILYKAIDFGYHQYTRDYSDFGLDLSSPRGFIRISG